MDFREEDGGRDDHTVEEEGNEVRHDPSCYEEVVDHIKFLPRRHLLHPLIHKLGYQIYFRSFQVIIYSHCSPPWTAAGSRIIF